MNQTKKIAVTTDSNSGLLESEVQGQQIFVLPMPFLVSGECYFENVNLSQMDFYRLLAEGADVSTSQPSVGELTEFWLSILKEYDQIVHIPMSSGLSQSYASAAALSKEFDGKVFVVDNHRISVTQKESVLDAAKLRDAGKTAEEIKAYLEGTSGDSSIYIAVDTMKYLKKGGRVTPAAAMIGTILKIKPVLQIHGEKLDKYVLARNTLKAKEAMKEALKRDLTNEFAELVKAGEMAIYVAHTDNEAEAEKFAEELKTVFPNLPVRGCAALPLSISCHIGPKALAVACARYIPED